MWKYERWGLVDQVGSDLIDLAPDFAKFAPPAGIFHYVYWPWTGIDVHQQRINVNSNGVITIGGETDVWLLATMPGRSDLGSRVILVSNALRFGDESHGGI